MELRPASIAVKFAGGVETKMDSKAVPTTRLLALENGVFTKAISIKKRNGYAARSRAIDGSTDLVTSGRRLGVRDDELLMFTDNRCFSYQDDADQWSDAGAVISARGSDRSVVRTGTAQTSPDHATNAGISVFAWEDSRGGVWWTTRDAESGRVHRAPTQADAAGERPRCVAAGELLHVYYAVPAQRRVMVIVVNPATPAADSPPAVLIDDLHETNPVYDAEPTPRENRPAVIAWAEHGTSTFRVGYVDPGGVLGSPASGHPSIYRDLDGMDADSPIAVTYNGFIGTDVLGEDETRFVVARVLAANVHATAYDAGDLANGITISSVTDLVMFAATDVQRIAATFTRSTAAATAECWVVAEEAAAETSERFCTMRAWRPLTGAATTAARTQRSVGLASRAFTAGDFDDAFAYFIHDTVYSNTYFALRLADSLPVARQVVGAAGGAPERSHLPSAVVDGDSVATCLTQKERLQSENNDRFGEVGLRLLQLDFDDPSTHQTAQLGRSLYMAGACPMQYDGRAWTEQGFHVAPELIETTPGGGGSMTASATYNYFAWYEHTDAQGEVHRGPASVDVQVTLGGAQTQVDLTLPTLRLTLRENVRIVVARSLANDDTRFFLVSSLDPTTVGAAANGFVENDTTVDSVTLRDRMSDADLLEQSPAYTTGGILSNDPAPLGDHVAVGNNRLFFSDAAEPHTVRYSQELAPGFGVEVAPELFVPCDPFGGEITAIAVMDDKVIVFKRGAIFVFNGDGPLANGDTSTRGFSLPRLVTSDVGCSSPTSIVLVPAGLMFKSQKGIYLLDRGLSVSYVGSAVEAYNAQDVVRAHVMPDRSQVLFLTSSGLSLLYDFLFGQWSTFTNHEGRDSAVVENTYCYLRLDDRVFAETIGAHSDAGTRITLRFETAWIHFVEHLQGLQRFWELLLLGTWSSPHQLGIQYQTNFEENWSDPWWLDATGESDSAGWLTGDSANPIGAGDPITGSAYGDGNYGDGPYGGDAPGVYQWRIALHSEGQSIRFAFEDFERDGLAGATFELTEMLITGGVIGSSNRPHPASRST